MARARRPDRTASPLDEEGGWTVVPPGCGWLQNLQLDGATGTPSAELLGPLSGMGDTGEPRELRLRVVEGALADGRRQRLVIGLEPWSRAVFARRFSCTQPARALLSVATEFLSRLPREYSALLSEVVIQGYEARSGQLSAARIMRVAAASLRDGGRADEHADADRFGVVALTSYARIEAHLEVDTENFPDRGDSNRPALRRVLSQEFGGVLEGIQDTWNLYSASQRSPSRISMNVLRDHSWLSAHHYKTAGAPLLQWLREDTEELTFLSAQCRRMRPVACIQLACCGLSTASGGDHGAPKYGMDSITRMLQRRESAASVRRPSSPEWPSLLERIAALNKVESTFLWSRLVARRRHLSSQEERLTISSVARLMGRRQQDVSKAEGQPVVRPDFLLDYSAAVDDSLWVLERYLRLIAIYGSGLPAEMKESLADAFADNISDADRLAINFMDLDLPRRDRVR